MDLLVLLSRYQWRKILNLYRKLPNHAGSKVARDSDDELVFPILDHLDETGDLKKGGNTRPPAEGYTREMEKYDQLIAAVYGVFNLVDNYLTKGKNKTPPIPVPETSRERWERQRSMAKHSSLVDEVKQAQQRYAARKNTKNQ